MRVGGLCGWLGIAALVSAGVTCGDSTVSETGTGGGGGAGAASSGSGGTTGGSAPTGGGGSSGGLGGAGGTSASSGSDGGGGAAGAGGYPVATGADDCPGDSYSLTAPTTLVLGGDTATASHLHTGAMCSGGAIDSSGPERVYELTFLSGGSLKVLVEQASGSTLDPTLYLRSPCSQGSSTLGCFSDFSTKEGFASDVPQPTSWFLFVDSSSRTSSEYVLTIDLQSPVCGDGAVSPNGADGIPNTPDDEECDDGNLVNGDGCQSDCKFNMVPLFNVCDGEPVVIQ
ncbi:MAG: DUF4215 domain-containing protein, partial [Deltaproteobacteria bacterium]|nr:DUF4215 domain-containing protein [Deltaproteobacteria bacterium]